MLTLFVSLFVLAMGTRAIVQEAAVQKVLALGFLAGLMARTLATFSLGILACAVLYAFTICYEGALVRRKIDFDHAKSKGHPP